MSSPSEIEQYLAKLIISVAHSERSVEKARLDLVSNRFFIPYSYFRRLDQKGKGYLTQDDFTDFLYSGGLNHNTKEVEHIFTLGTTAGATKMTYNDFLKIVLPQADNAVKNECLDRVSKGQAELGESEQQEIDNAVLGVFLKEIEFYRQTKKARLSFISLKEFNPNTAFMIIDTKAQGFLDFNSIQSFLNRLAFSFKQEDYDALCRRIDKSRSGKISFQDFKDGLFESGQKGVEREPSARNTGMTRSSSAYLNASDAKNSLSNATYQRSSRFSVGKETPVKFSRGRGSYDTYKGNAETQKLQRFSEVNQPQQRDSYGKPVTNLLDDFLQPPMQTAEFNKSQSEGSQVVFLPKPTVEILGSKGTRGEQMTLDQAVYFNSGRKTEAGINNVNYANKFSKETINLPINPSAGDFNSIHTEEKELQHFGSVEDIHRVRSAGGFTTARRNYFETLTSPPSKGGSPANIRKNRFAGENDENTVEITMSPLRQRTADPVDDMYWGYNKHHNETIATCHPFTAVNFPYDLTRTMREPVAYDMKSSFLPHHYAPIDEMKVDVKRFKENPFRFTDHEHYFKLYYNRLRGGYYDKYFNIPQAQHKTYIYKDPDVQHYNDEIQPETPLPMRRTAHRASSQDTSNARYVLLKTLRNDPEYTSGHGHWPRPEGRATSTYRRLDRMSQENLEPGLVRPGSVRYLHNEHQKPARDRNVSDFISDTRYDNRVDYDQVHRGPLMNQINLLNRPRYQSSQGLSHLFPNKPS